MSARAHQERSNHLLSAIEVKLANVAPGWVVAARKLVGWPTMSSRCRTAGSEACSAREDRRGEGVARPEWYAFKILCGARHVTPGAG